MTSGGLEQFVVHAFPDEGSVCQNVPSAKLLSMREFTLLKDKNRCAKNVSNIMCHIILHTNCLPFSSGNNCLFLQTAVTLLTSLSIIPSHRQALVTGLYFPHIVIGFLKAKEQLRFEL